MRVDEKKMGRVQTLLKEVREKSPAAGRLAEEMLMIVLAEESLSQTELENNRQNIREQKTEIGKLDDHITDLSERLDEAREVIAEELNRALGNPPTPGRPDGPMEWLAMLMSQVRSLLSTEGSTLEHIYGLFHETFEGSPWDVKDGDDHVSAIYRVFREFGATVQATTPATVTEEQLRSMYEQSQRLLQEASDLAAERGEKIESAVNANGRIRRRADRLQLAFNQEQDRRKQTEARMTALTLVATETELEPPGKHDFEWSPGIDTIRHLRQESAMRLDGWQRFEQEANRLRDMNQSLVDGLNVQNARVKELEGFIESARTQDALEGRAALSDQSDVVPGQEIPTNFLQVHPDAAALIDEFGAQVRSSRED